MAGQIKFVFTDEFKESYEKLPHHIKKKVKKQLKFLQTHPAHPSLKIHKLNGEWEFYVDYFYRAFFLREGPIIILLTLGTHKIVDRYRKK